ncbi:hypothetical protein T06_537 [Trichinella sp. T6]|nr:hypothetical protein T06_537 [Trichinella sp. T6]
MTVGKDLPMYSRIFEVLLSKAEELGAQLQSGKICLLYPCHSRQPPQHPNASLLLPLLPSRFGLKNDFI